MGQVMITNPADLKDQHWLDAKIEQLASGIDAARDIWLNWTDIRNVSRFAGGLSYGDFIKARLGYALPLADVIRIMPDASTREIAKVAGVSQGHPALRAFSGERNLSPDDQPATVLGADGKHYPARVVPAVVIDMPVDDIDLDASPDAAARTAAYVSALLEYIHGVVLVQPPTLGDPPAAYRRRHALERQLRDVVVAVMS